MVEATPTLPTDTDTLHSLVGNLQELLYNKEVHIQKLEEQLRLSNQHRFGQHSEKLKKLDVKQLEWDFFNEAELVAALAKLEEEEQVATEVAAHRRQGRRKRPLSAKLARVEVIQKAKGVES